MNPTNLPYRFRESAFRTYEPQIDLIVQRFPTAVSFLPANVETFSCRLRDAMRSLAAYGWSYPRLDAFRQIYPRISVGIRGDQVIAGGRQEVRRWGSETSIDTDAPAPKPPFGVPSPTIRNPDSKALESLFYLHHHRLLTTPTILHFDNPDTFKSTIPVWEQNFDIAIEQVDEKTFKVL